MLLLIQAGIKDIHSMLVKKPKATAAITTESEPSKRVSNASSF